MSVACLDGRKQLTHHGGGLRGAGFVDGPALVVYRAISTDLLHRDD